MRWLTRYPLGLIVGAACLVIAPAGRLSADQPLESLTRAWDGRQSRTKTAHFEWTESIVKDRDPLVMDPTELNEEQGVNVLILGNDASMRHEFRPPQNDSERKGNFAVRSSAFTSAFNGQRNSQLNTATNKDDYPRGIIWNSASHDEIANYHIRPLLLTYRPLLTPIPNLEARRFHVVAQEAMVAERPCLVIESIAETPGGMTDTYWVDVERDGIILQHVEKAQGRATAQLTIDYKHDSEHGWVPMSWDAMFLKPDGSPSMTTRASVLKYEINTEVASDAFEVAFEPGTLVFDRDEGCRWFVLPDGSRRLITNDESQQGFNYADLAHTKAGELAGAKTTEFSGSRIAFVVVNVVGFSGLAVYVLFRVLRYRAGLSTPK